MAANRQTESMSRQAQQVLSLSINGGRTCITGMLERFCAGPFIVATEGDG